MCSASYSVAGHINQALHLVHVSCKFTGDLSLCAQTNKPRTLSLFISLYFLLLFVTSSLFLAYSSVIVQQIASLCMLSKRKPLGFLLCSQFILIDCSLTFHYVQWIIKRFPAPSSYGGVKKLSLIHLTSDSTLIQMMIYSSHTWISHQTPFSVQSSVHSATTVVQALMWYNTNAPKAIWEIKHNNKTLIAAFICCYHLPHPANILQQDVKLFLYFHLCWSAHISLLNLYSITRLDARMAHLYRHRHWAVLMTI